MAERTIDIIYRFIADTKAFEQGIKGMNVKELAQLEAPRSYKDLEKTLHGVEGEISRLGKLNRLTADDAAKIKKQYFEAANAVNKMTRAIEHAKKAMGEVEVSAQFARGRGGMPTDQLKDFYDRFQRNALTRAEIAMAMEKGGRESLTSGELGKMFNTGSRVAKEMGDRIKVTRVELSKFNTEVQKTKKERATLEEIGRAVMVKGFSFYGLRMTGASIAQQGQLMSLIGGGVSGGMFKLASDYIKNLEGATETSREWAKQMERVEKANKSIGEVIASQSLPLLEKGADLLGKVANWLERNPEAAGTAMKAGLTLAGLGALVIAVGKGITLVADVAFLAATVNMLKGGRDSIIAAGSFRMSANTMLKAATINAGAAKLTIGKFAPLNKLAPPIARTPILTGAGGAAGAAAGGFSLGALAAAAAGFLAGALIADKAFDKILGHDQKFGGYITTFKQVITLAAKDLGDLIEKIGKPFGVSQDLGEQWFKKVRNALFDVDKASEEAADGLEGISDILKNSLKRDEVLDAYEDYKADDLELVRKHYDERQATIRKSNEDERKEMDDYANDIRKINAELGKDLASATKDYNAQEQKDEQQYARQRAEILREAGEQQAKEEEQLQERLRKLRLDYEERSEELLAARDAVGLIKNRKKYLRDAAEAQREANREIIERRRDLAQRLNDLQIAHEQERAERFAEYKQRILEIQANAREQLEERRKQHDAEMKEIAINRNNRLRELDLQLVEERRRRLNAFLAQVRDLDATLLGEEQRRKQHYATLLRDLDSFLARYRSGQSTLLTTIASTVQGRQVGGYVKNGLYRLHDNEYVLNPNTTRVLEQLIGGQLTQAGVIQMARNNRTNITLNDSRRFDSSLRPSERRAIQQDTIETFNKIVEGINV